MISQAIYLISCCSQNLAVRFSIVFESQKIYDVSDAFRRLYFEIENSTLFYLLFFLIAPHVFDAKYVSQLSIEALSAFVLLVNKNIYYIINSQF